MKNSNKCVIIDNGTCELVCRVISPEDANIQIIGGEGRQFEVDLVNYDTKTKENTECGWGQIAITDKIRRKNIKFIIEMEIVKKENL